ncbi:MAG: Hsp33 family molecular chaperone [Candidatus Cloacimonetes bacterium 4572_65]|nr:MAG: Hsp33 family molecular chaperone [Candidatus Cloacimonetes bacterium 4572_65]
MKDRAIRGIAANKQIRFFAVDSTNTVQLASKAHYLSVTATIFLGRMLTAGIMMGMDLKDEDSSLTLKITSDGPLAGATVISKNKGITKGYVNNPDYEMEAESSLYGLSIGKAVGAGTFTVTKDLNMGQPFSGQTELVSGEVGDDIAQYFLQSEQIPSAVGLGILVNPDASVRSSGGFIVQLMPFTEEETIAKLEANIGKIPNVSDLLDMGKDIETILREFVLKGFDVKITDELEPNFACDCSKAKFRNGLKLLGVDDIKDAIKEDGELKTLCHFCNSEYRYDAEELEQIIKELK